MGIKKVCSYILLVSVYITTWIIAGLAKIFPHRKWEPNGRIAVTGTIFNPNWYLSHITPLTQSGVNEVILVIDEPMQPLDKVRFVCPPKWLAKIISRAGAKALWMLYVGIKYRPDLFMGYNLVAGGCTALVAGSLCGRKTCYQMTGGQLVLSTIGVDNFDYAKKTSNFRKKITKTIEQLSIQVIKKFDLIVVRGNKGKTFLADYGITDNVAIITGSVKSVELRAQSDRNIDIVFIGRLNPIKQVDQCIEIIKKVSVTIPSVQAVIVGDGSLMNELKELTEKLELTDNIEFLGKRENIEDILSSSKVFLLTSKSEGSSIAMAEAMMAGSVPVVADVGELSDLISNGINGYLISPCNIGEYSDRILSLLQNKSQWESFSSQAKETAVHNCCLEVISEKWRNSIQNILL